ncbi:MAG: hypothetical protein NT154_47810, partial [Verrucomicrobia bacterium]|nr:hypothetical protein [Verrucomicrobiota bacterium]
DHRHLPPARRRRELVYQRQPPRQTDCKLMIWIAPSEKDTATNTLEKRLWDAADQLRANSGLISLRLAEVNTVAKQIRNLRRRRDLLLPRLLSGQVTL